jgi:transcriptional regulator with XRE-family HTH domain
MTLHTKELEVLDNFRANLQSIMKSQNLSEAELSARAGFEEASILDEIMRGRTLPNMAAPVRLADALGIPVDVLLRDRNDHLKGDFEALPMQEVDRQAAQLLSAVFKATERSLDRIGDRPTLDSIIAWWKETDGDLSRSEQIAPHFDLVSAAEALTSIPRIHHVGALGLSATTLGSADNSRLENFLETLSTSDLTELNGQIRSVAHSGVGMITPLKRIVPFPETNETAEVSFVRLMLPVRDASGTLFVLNYSTLLSESTPRRTDG